MSDVSEGEIRLCKRVCLIAKANGYGLKELNTPLGISFVWLLPNGEELSGQIRRSQDKALLSAVQKIAAIIFTHV